MDTNTNFLLRTSLYLIGPGLLLASPPAHALDPFTDASDTLVNSNLASGVALGIADMNGDGLDDIVRLDDAHDFEIEYQLPDGGFQRYAYGGLPGSQWALAIGDIDGNGYPDVFSSGAYNGLKILRANEAGDDYELTIMAEPGVFTQCANFADIDNNGTLDLFVCHDDGISAPLNNDGTGSFTYDLGLINAESTLPSDNSGNYGSVWTDYDSDGDLDLYIAKCRLFVEEPLDGRRLNLLFQNDGEGNYTEVAEAVGLRPGAQSWAMDFGDIDNDGDMDAFLVNHDMLSQLYENRGPGADDQIIYSEITEAAGMIEELQDVELGIQAHFEDFDNDTFIDLLVTSSGGGDHKLFMNNGDQSFTAADAPFPTDGLGIQSAVVGDLDTDGFPDVLAGFASGFNNPSSGNPDRVFINPGNGNNFLDVRLTGVQSNTSAVGARVELHGAWGVQVREVRAGESYGITNSLTRHFGLGTAETIDQVVVRWPSGQVDVSDNPAVLNEVVHITEGCPDVVWFADADADGFGDPSASMPGCLRPQGHIENDLDCNDADGANFPDNPEVCDGQDNDCDGEVDEGLEGCNDGGSSGDDTTAGPTPGTTGDDPTTGPGTGSGPSGPSDPTAPAGSGTGGTGDAGANDDGGSSGGCAIGRAGSRAGDRSGGRPGFGGMILLGLGLLGLRRRAWRDVG